MLRIKIPQENLEKLLFKLRNEPREPALVEATESYRPEHGLLELLYHRTLGFSGLSGIQRLRPGFHPVLVRLTRSVNTMLWRRCLAEARNLDRGASLLFGINGQSLEAFFAGPLTEHFRERACLMVPGPCMQNLRLSAMEEKPMSDADDSVAEESGLDAEGAGQYEPEQFNKIFGRLGGAIGNGDIEAGLEILSRARRLKVVVVGAGRAGSWLAYRLAKCGVGSEAGLIIVDPDVVEESNIPDMNVPTGAVGWPKAEAVASTVMAMVRDARPIPFNAGLDSEEVVHEICTSDVVFTTVDEDSARLGVAILAARYHLVHIDVSGGCSWMGRGQAAVGGELRVFIPGTPGCLACMTNADWREAERLLTVSVEQERDRRAHLEWQGTKAGSSADILYPVLGEAVQALWAILRGELRRSVWWHYGKTGNGMPVWEDWSSSGRWRRCRVCSQQAGLGDLIA